MKRSLNLNKLNDRPRIAMSSKEALKDVIPFVWSQEVLEGRKKIVVTKSNK